MAQVIRCADYDYFELVCIRQSKVSLRLRDGKCLQGIATDLVQKKSQEFLQLQVQSQLQLIDLIQISQLSVQHAPVAEHNFTITFAPPNG